MDRTYIYTYFEYYDYYLSDYNSYLSDHLLTADELWRSEGMSDKLYGVYDTEEELGRAIAGLFMEGYCLLPCSKYNGIIRKYCPPSHKKCYTEGSLFRKYLHMIYPEHSEEDIRDALLLSAECGLYDEYGIEPDDDPVIGERLREELGAIVENGNLHDIAVLHELSEWMRKDKHPFWLTGSAGSSLLLYLLRITRCNPLFPHYYYCGNADVLSGYHRYNEDVMAKILWFRPENAYRDGFDAPQLKGPDGYGLYGNGHDIPWKILWPDDRPSWFEVRLPAALMDDVKHWLGGHWIFTRCPHLKAEYPAPDRIHFSHIQLRFDIDEDRISHREMRDAYDISKRSRDGWAGLVIGTSAGSAGMAAAFTEISKLELFSDAVYLYGILNTNDVRDREIIGMMKEKNMKLSDLVIFKDDVFHYLKKHGFSDAAASFGTRAVNSGHGLAEIRSSMRDSDDSWIIDWCSSIKYLIPKAHAIEHLIFKALYL